MDTATFEAMRAAMDRRFGAWAVALAVEARRPGADAQAESKAAIFRLLQSGDLYAYRSTFGWGAEERLTPEEARELLEDPRQWQPRRIGYRRLVRFSVTDDGRRRFSEGQFGLPEPILRQFVPASERLELEPVTASELMGMFLAVVGFLAGGWLTSVMVGANAFGASQFGGFQMVLMAIGATLGMVGAVSLSRKSFGAPTQSAVTDESIVPDQYMDGPTLNPMDEFGEPRF